MIPCASLMQPSFLASLPSHGLTKTPSLDVDRAFSSWFCSAFCITHLRMLDATIRPRAIIARSDVFSVGHQLLNPISCAEREKSVQARPSSGTEGRCSLLQRGAC